MPLINCKECGETISNNAKNCPKCGAPVSSIFKRAGRIIQPIGIALIGLGLFVHSIRLTVVMTFEPWYIMLPVVLITWGIASGYCYLTYQKNLRWRLLAIYPAIDKLFIDNLVDHIALQYIDAIRAYAWSEAGINDPLLNFYAIAVSDDGIGGLALVFIYLAAYAAYKSEKDEEDNEGDYEEDEEDESETAKK